MTYRTKHHTLIEFYCATRRAVRAGIALIPRPERK
jgi:hypothetical protein